MELDAVHVVRNGVLGSMTMENSRKGANGIRGCQCHRKLPVCLVFACASIRTSVDLPRMVSATAYTANLIFFEHMLVSRADGVWSA